MKKKLSVDNIINELEGGASLFFSKLPTLPSSEKTPTLPAELSITSQEASKTENRPLSPQVKRPGKKATKNNIQDSNNASTLASNQDSTIEVLRKFVKTIGKEVSFVRLTPEEKARLTDIVYTYKRQGIKTSENEINRIAINHLIEDYEANGENSVLAKVIAALNA